MPFFGVRAVFSVVSFGRKSYNAYFCRKIEQDSHNGKEEKTMDNFAAIDLETANKGRTSLCSVGLVIVREQNGGLQSLAARHFLTKSPKTYYYLTTNFLLFRM
jgi:hypothetical protein